tara:strand:+ start:732 stop:992 length:261 start_codon:yes stop_codon:yes gene_type:complete
MLGEVAFTRTKTTSCSTGKVTADEVTARMSHGMAKGWAVIATIKMTQQPSKFDNWKVEWKNQEVSRSHIEQVLEKLIELNDEKESQ